MFAFSLHNDDVEDFDVRWYHALLSVSEMSSDPILEGLKRSNLQYDQETARNKKPNYQQLKTAVKLHIKNDVVERGSVTKSQKETKPMLRGKWKSVFSGRHKDNVPKEIPVVSVMTLYWLLATEVVVTVKDGNDDRLLPHPMQRQNRLTERNKKPHRDYA